MPMIVVIDDDAGTRLLVSQVLKKEGYQVMAAEDGPQGLALVRQLKPALVISDVQMPQLDGFGVLDQIRSDTALAGTSVILLTSLQDRSSMRQGMTTGADDYLTKPFAPQELRQAVSAQMEKRGRAQARQIERVDQAVRIALQEQSHKIAELYEARMLKALSEQWPESAQVKEDERFASATVLFADMRDYSLWTTRLNSAELTEIVQQLYTSVGDTVYLFGARYMQFVGDGMLCVFVDAADTDSVNHGFRAMRAALGLASATKRLDGYVRQRWPERGLPAFSLGVALHSGPVAFVSLADLSGRSGQTTPVGDTVAAALKLFHGEPGLGWSVAASAQAVSLVSSAVRTGQRTSVRIPGRSEPLDTLEVLGLA